MSAITESEYKRENESKWVGREVQNLRPLKNGWAEMPIGTKFTIERKFKGFSLVSEPCKCCGIRVHISKVHFTALEVITR